MGKFSSNEVDFLMKTTLGRIATVGVDHQPHVVPVGFRFNPTLETIDISGYDFRKSKKWRDTAVNNRVAFVVDEAPPGEWRPRGVEVRGRVERLDHDGAAMLRLVPHRIVAWGIDTGAFDRNARNVTTDIGTPT